VSKRGERITTPGKKSVSAGQGQSGEPIEKVKKCLDGRGYLKTMLRRGKPVVLKEGPLLCHLGLCRFNGTAKVSRNEEKEGRGLAVTCKKGKKSKKPRPVRMAKIPGFTESIGGGGKGRLGEEGREERHQTGV